jgi:putative membrane protein
MSNEQLIKSAHMYAVVAIVCLLGVVLFATRAESNPTHVAQQNQNSNTNSNSNTSSNQNAKTKTSNTNNANASGEQTAAGAMSAREQKFLTDAAMGGLMEVELGHWAAQKGTSEEVKQFGRRMVDDHSRANTELTQLASSKGVTLPTQLDEKHQKEVSKISRLTGADFDRAYSKMMLKDHEHDVSDFEKQSTSGEDADVKAFASKTLPTLQEHLQMARALPGNAKPAKSSSNANSNSNSNSNRP